MATRNVNRVVIIGNLTRDPELRSTPAGTPVCSLRLASNSRRRDASGEWFDKPNFFDVTVWGAAGETCATYLSKGSRIAVDGRLEWREWEDADGNRRQAVEIVAESVQFLSSPDRAAGDRQSDVDGDTDGLEPAGVAAGGEEEDIPF